MRTLLTIALARHPVQRRYAALMLAMIAAPGTDSSASLVVFGHDRVGPPVQQVPLAISPPQNSSFHQSGAQFAASPDGRFVALIAIQQGQAALWVQPLAAGSAVRLPGTEDASYPFWSPDARLIGFFANGKLKTAPVDGGPVNVLCEAPSGRGGSWGIDGNIIFTPSPADVLFRVSSGGGNRTPLTRVAGDTERSHRWPQFLPDGRRFLYLVTYQAGRDRLGEVRIGSLDSSETVSLGLRTASSATYGAGHILFMRDGTLMAVKLDSESQQTVGDPFSVAAHVRTDDNFYTAVSASSTGVLLSQRDSATRKTRLTWMDRNGNVLGSIGEPGQYMNIALAPDDRLVAVSLVSGTPGNRDIWVIDGARGTATRLTFDPANDAVPMWSRDSRSIVFESYRSGPPSIFRMAAGSAGDEVQLLNSGSNDIPEDWSADGKFVTFTRSTPGTSLDLWILPLNGSRKPFAFVATTAEEDDARFDPSGRWIAYTSNASGRYEVYVRPFPPGAGEYRVSREGGRSPMWRADGKELFFLTRDGTLMASAIDTTRGFRSGDPRSLFRTGASEMVTAGNAHQYAVSRDGRRFLINRADPHDDSTPLTTVLNWPALPR